MPAPVIKKLAKEHGISKKKLEKDWGEAELAAFRSYERKDPKYWGTVMKIFKAKVNKHHGVKFGKPVKSKVKEGMLTNPNNKWNYPEFTGYKITSESDKSFPLVRFKDYVGRLNGPDNR